MNAIYDVFVNALTERGLIDKSYELPQKAEVDIDIICAKRKKYNILSNNDLGIELSNENRSLVVLAYIDECLDLDSFTSEVWELIKNNYARAVSEGEIYFYFFFVFNDLGARFEFESYVDKNRKFSAKNLREAKLFKEKLKIVQKNIIVTYEWINLHKEKKPAKINVKSKLLVSQYVRDEEYSEIGSVFVAKLRDIVRLFESVGNDLFKNNIRFGIKDNNSVDYNITETLKREPDFFWFLNNGITIFANGYLDLSEDDSITIKSSNYSVLNGAQTITSATKFFYSLNNSEDEKREAEKNAYVLLRIIEGETENIEKITVGLNRQKPISADDIHIVEDWVINLNEKMADHDSDIGEEYRFQIIRKGEVESIAAKNYLLSTVTRFIKAVTEQKPGPARSQGITQLLKDFKIGTELEDQEIIKKFGYINRAILMESEISKISATQTFREKIKGKTNHDAYEAIIKYGKYHLISGYINSRCPDLDYGKSNEIRELSESELMKILDKFYSAWTDYYDELKNEKNIWDSNMFKTDGNIEVKGGSFIARLIKNLISE